MKVSELNSIPARGYVSFGNGSVTFGLWQVSAMFVKEYQCEFFGIEDAQHQLNGAVEILPPEAIGLKTGVGASLLRGYMECVICLIHGCVYRITHGLKEVIIDHGAFENLIDSRLFVKLFASVLGREVFPN